MNETEKRTKAWIGDAVLALFAREWILQRTDIPSSARADVFVQMTSNRFLSAIGEPTLMEAEIGVAYETEGLKAAFDLIEKKFLPIFLVHRKKEKKPGSYRKQTS